MTILFSLILATVVCLFLLVAFWLFTISPFGRRIEEEARRHTPRLG